MRLRYVCTALILGGCTLSGSAQTGSISAKVASGTQMSPVQAQEELLNLFEHEFMGVAQAMPADKYGFAPTSATFTASQAQSMTGFARSRRKYRMSQRRTTTSLRRFSGRRCR